MLAYFFPWYTLTNNRQSFSFVRSRPFTYKIKSLFGVTGTRSFFSLGNPRADYSSKVGSRLIAVFIGLNWPRKEIDDRGFSYTIKPDKFPRVNRATDLSSAEVYEVWTLKSLHIRSVS